MIAEKEALSTLIMTCGQGCRIAKSSNPRLDDILKIIKQPYNSNSNSKYFPQDYPTEVNSFKLCTGNLVKTCRSLTLLQASL